MKKYPGLSQKFRKATSLQKNLSQFIAETRVDELMVSSNLFDREAKIKSFSILHETMDFK